jgi:hypothetical protein
MHPHQPKPCSRRYLILSAMALLSCLYLARLLPPPALRPLAGQCANLTLLSHTQAAAASLRARLASSEAAHARQAAALTSDLSAASAELATLEKDLTAAEAELAAAEQALAQAQAARAPAAPSASGSGKLALMLVFKNEARSLREWLSHHQWQGVDLFLLLDNGSSDDWRAAVADFPTVTVLDAPARQVASYNALGLPWLRERGVEYVGVWDTDEFFFGSDGRSLKQVIVDTMGAAGGPDQLSCRGWVFGSSGHRLQPASLRQCFTRRSAAPLPELGYVKSIVRLSRLAEFNIHTHFMAAGAMSTPADALACAPGLGFNHYKIQSRQYWAEVKLFRKDVNNPAYDWIEAKKEGRGWSDFNALDLNDVQDSALADMVRRVEPALPEGHCQAPGAGWAPTRSATVTATATATAPPLPGSPPRALGVFTVDNRPLHSDLATAGYHSLSAAVNFHYALLHGYNFTLLQPRFDARALPAAAAALAAAPACTGRGSQALFTPSALAAALAAAAALPPQQRSKDGVAAWHPALQHFRAASWAKLPALWRATAGYDAALYLDSDVIVTRRDTDFVTAFSVPRDGVLAWGSDAGTASLVFGSNAPYNAALPCAGVWMVRPGAGGREQLRAWWDTPAHAVRHAYEQDALWGLLARADAGVCVNPHFTNASVAVLRTPQFPAGAHPAAQAPLVLEKDRYGEFSEDSWLHHTQEFWMGGRAAIMRRRLRELGVEDGAYADLIDRIRREHTLVVDVVQAAVDMHVETCQAEALQPPCTTYYSA